MKKKDNREVCDMLSFFENSWVVGTCTGIISSIFVFFITNAKNNSRRFEQINSANREIIHSLRPYVAEKGLPEKEIVNAIIVSTARKYNVKDKELYSICIICEELIHEIIENVYVSSDQKREYSLQLADCLRKVREEEQDEKEEKSSLSSDFEKELTQNNEMAVIMSACIGIVAGTVVGLLSFISSHTDPSVNEKLIDTMQASLVIPIIPSAIVLVGFFVILHIMRFLQKKKNRTEESDKKSSNDK